ncbi:MAG: dihydroorotase [Deltaproteobacteria bacterium]|nr:MAG: dihydroorotase [Deltaproteobacteria bacterium]
MIQIKGGRLIDPENFDGIADIFVDNGKIVEIRELEEKGSLNQESSIPHPELSIIDATGKIVTPGLIDMHVHLREPGYEYKETIKTGCQAAAAGGITTVCCMPNTNPVNDNRQVTEYILKKAAECKTAHVFPVAAISKGLGGKELCEYQDLKGAGAVAVSDDGLPVMDSQLMRRALEHARRCDLLVISHCEDLNLLAGGVMNEGALATRLGLAGIPNACESIMVMREIALAELTESPVHIAHVSTKESVRAIRDAKKRGVPVTAETAPHYFTLTEEVVEEYSTNAKMNPPLRSREDRAAIREGLADGTIDVIATDHAPHSSDEKDVEFDKAPNGVIGLETSVSLGLKLVEDGVISVHQLVEKMSICPAKILGLDNGLKVGNAADITIIDPTKEYTVDTTRFRSLSRNTPFKGWNLRGKAALTMVMGRVVFEEN